MIEDTVEDLVNAKCIQLDEEELGLQTANLGRIAAFYGIKYSTMDVFARNLEDENILSKRMRALLSVLTQANEFESCPIRHGEE